MNIFRLVIFAIWALCSIASSQAQELENSPCSRIISLAPSITEVLFQLDLGDSVVGVTDYCQYPKEALSKTKIGGLLNTNTELLLSLKPTMVVLLKEDVAQREKLEKLGLRTEVVDHRSVDGILESVESIGKLCSRRRKAKDITESLSAKILDVRERAPGKGLKALIVIGGVGEEGSVSSLYVSGDDGFYSELLQILGATNVFRGPTSGIGTISSEGLVSLDPDVIFEVNYMDSDLENGSVPGIAGNISTGWKRYQAVKAVRENHIFALSESYAYVPGPRFGLLLEKLERLMSLVKSNGNPTKFKSK